MKTVADDLRVFEYVTGLATSSLRKAVSIPTYAVKVKGYTGNKLYSTAILLDLTLQRTLAASPEFSAAAAHVLVKARLDKMDKIAAESRIGVRVNEVAQDNNINGLVHAKLLARTELVLRSGLFLPSLLMSVPELSTYIDFSPVTAYKDKLHDFADDLVDDMDELQRVYRGLSVPLDIEHQHRLSNLWQQALDSLSGVESWTAAGDASSTPASVSYEAIKEKILSIHHSNAPFLWVDALRSMGHTGRVCDGPHDGSIDVDSVDSADETRYLSQVKMWRNPPIGAERIRQFAQTCRTYQVKGYYVTLYRYARNAAQGLYPLSDNGADERHKIADVELVDLDTLARCVIQYKIGITGADHFDPSYWGKMQIPNSRKAEEGR